jgi:hypothetical protein
MKPHHLANRLHLITFLMPESERNPCIREYIVAGDARLSDLIHNERGTLGSRLRELAQLLAGITDPMSLAVMLVFMDSGMDIRDLGLLNVDSLSFHSYQGDDGSMRYFGTGFYRRSGSQRERTILVGHDAVVAVGLYLAERRSIHDALDLISDYPVALFLDDVYRLSVKRFKAIHRQCCRFLDIPPFTNSELRKLRRHLDRLGLKKAPSLGDIVDLGTCSDGRYLDPEPTVGEVTQ